MTKKKSIVYWPVFKVNWCTSLKQVMTRCLECFMCLTQHGSFSKTHIRCWNDKLLKQFICLFTDKANNWLTCLLMVFLRYLIRKWDVWEQLPVEGYFTATLPSLLGSRLRMLLSEGIIRCNYCSLQACLCSICPITVGCICTLQVTQS